MILNFGLVKSFSETDISINYDHKLIIESIDYFIYNYKLLSSNEYKIIELLLTLIKKYDNIKTIKPSNIINENPYIIEKKPEIKESYYKKIINYMKIRRFN